MKVFLIKHKNTADQTYNLCAYSEVEEVTTENGSGIFVKAVHAFLRKKDAQQHISELPEGVQPFREIVPFESKSSGELINFQANVSLLLKRNLPDHVIVSELQKIVSDYEKR